MRSDQERLMDIEDTILKIEKYPIKGKEVFLQDELIQTLILYNLQILLKEIQL